MAKGLTLKDRENNGIIVSTHIYPWKHDWQEKVLSVVDKYPILVGEVGAGAQKMTWLPSNTQEDAVTWGPAMLALIQKYKTQLVYPWSFGWPSQLSDPD